MDANCCQRMCHFGLSLPISLKPVGGVPSHLGHKTLGERVCYFQSLPSNFVLLGEKAGSTVRYGSKLRYGTKFVGLKALYGSKLRYDIFSQVRYGSKVRYFFRTFFEPYSYQLNYRAQTTQVC